MGQWPEKTKNLRIDLKIQNTRNEKVWNVIGKP